MTNRPYDRHSPIRPAFSGVQTQPDGRRFVADDKAALANYAGMLLAKRGPLAIDIETTGTDGADPFQVKVVTIGNRDLVLALDPRDAQQLHLVRYMTQHAPSLVLHNAAFDVPPLVHWGMLALDDIAKIHDTMVYVRMADPDSLTKKTLTAVAHRYLGLQSDTTASITDSFRAAGYKRNDDGWRYMDIDSPVYLRGALTDTAVTAQLFAPTRKAAIDRQTNHPFGMFGITDRDEATAVVDREQIVNRVMLRRSAIGIPIDDDVLDNYRDAQAKTKDEGTATLTAAGITPGNGNHLTTFLDKIGEIPADFPRTATGKISATAENLESLTHEYARIFVGLKQMDKVAGYLESVSDMAKVDGRIHPMVGVLGASQTGRMAYSAPPLQQFSAEARGILVAEPGKELTSIDWSSVEPILMATMAGQTSLLDAYAGGGDLYGPIVDQTGVERKTAKVVLLSTMYGSGAKKLGMTLKSDEDHARRIRQSILDSIPEARKFITRTKDVGDQYGLALTISGRILTVPTDPRNGQRMAYKATNFTVQGSGYDVLADSILRCHEAGLSDAIVLAMHDELVVETDAAYDVRRIMETPPTRLSLWSPDRQPILRCDAEDMGKHWKKV